jgi:hypothetical protein
VAELTSPALFPTTANTLVTTTHSSNSAPECTEKDDFTGVLSDCSKFLRCDHGRFVEMKCAPGTLFDSSNRICEHERLVSCLSKVSQDECSLQDDFSPVKNDCSKFRRCSNGKFIELQCPDGTLFDRYAFNSNVKQWRVLTPLYH